MLPTENALNITEVQTRSTVSKDTESPLESFLSKRFGTADFQLTEFQTQESRATRKGSSQKDEDAESPLMYAANFQRGGWAVVTDPDHLDNPVLAYSETGTFDYDRIESPEVKHWFSLVESALAALVNEKKERRLQESERSYPISYDEDYYWVRLPIAPIIEFTENARSLNHLIETKWGQGSPWNYKCNYGDTRFAAGCVAVAIGQILYYCHYNLNCPNGLYHSIHPTFSYNFSGGYYSISNANRSQYNSNSTRWDSMATDSFGPQTGKDYVGDLLVDIGYRISMQYKPSGSGAYSQASNFNSFGIACSEYTFSHSKIMSSLDSGQPVYISSGTTGQGRHAWIIDGYMEDLTKTINRYKWVMMPPDSLSYYPSIDYDYVLTESEKQRYYPNIVENQIVTETASLDYDTYYRMNWGWDGDYDDILFRDYTNWQAGEYTFVHNSGTSLYTNFRYQ